MKNSDLICSILLRLINYFYTFLYQKLVVLITASTKAVMAITYSKKLKLNVESESHKFTIMVVK